MEKELDVLVEYLGKNVSDIEVKLQNDKKNHLLQGELKGLQHALRINRMYNMHEDRRHSIDIEID
ncbi:hypothetical protein OB236_22345 [Paenibacillus sp. WQ 127069]|uniref:Uncharacterized protein n=1 Tax=Paenibacillus baimaensis TaxID=2982185 RepID=A0ABT2UJR5_9BACL|nr:hypothetical protein [Paenibacillus sp. WQ 127069]MCU6794857.1 hypothetical protein [Paenibacillus sp. WQ 127069]